MTDNLRCSYCNKEFKYESEKKRHELSHFPRFKCDVCNKKFSFNSALRRHEKQHQRTEKVQCKQCKRSFRDESLLKRHNKYAHKGQYTCIKCYAEFHSELALSIHQKTHNAKSERRYHCGYDGCEKTFNFPHHLKHHEMTHTNTKQYYCHICKKGFIQFHHFKSHMRTHEQEKWLHCTEINCKKTFPTETAKKRHLLRVHNIKLSDISTTEFGETKIEYKYDVEIDTVLCTTCGKIINLSIYEEHQSKCSLTCNENSGEICNDRLEVQEHTRITNDDNSDHINDCKSALGSCIVGGDTSENCLCAQIKTTPDNYYDNTIIPNENINSTNIQCNSQQFESYKPNNNGNFKEGCENCACSGNLQSNFDPANEIYRLGTNQQNIENKNCSFRNNLNISLPDIEYKLDGSIKLKDTFDEDIKVFENVNAENKENKKIEMYNSYVPFNSCKAVLGNCIVSGNGTISEECLCAKMLVDEHQVTAEEIDEITPRPVSSTYLSVI